MDDSIFFASIAPILAIPMLLIPLILLFRNPGKKRNAALIHTLETRCRDLEMRNEVLRDKIRCYDYRVKELEELNAKHESATFTESEIKTLIGLCHPDKHGGNNERASIITTKLLRIKKSFNHG